MKNEDKQRIIEKFITDLNEQNYNQIDIDNGMEDAFGPDKLFSIICNKCGSLDIHMSGEESRDYGGITGHQPGTSIIKCKKCGASLTIWHK